MSKYPIDRSWWTFIVLTLYFNAIVFAEYNSPVPLSGEFGDFLKDLESMVFKKTKEEKHVLLTTTEENLFHNSQNIMSKGQKATLRDALMMKLVSYYENKYKLFPHDATTLGITRSYREDDFNKRRYNEVELIDENPIFDSFTKKATRNSIAEVVVV